MSKHFDNGAYYSDIDLIGIDSVISGDSSAVVIPRGRRVHFNGTVRLLGGIEMLHFEMNYNFISQSGFVTWDQFANSFSRGERVE